MIRRPPRSTLFPYTRSSDLTPSRLRWPPSTMPVAGRLSRNQSDGGQARACPPLPPTDRKSTRLNSSHSQISYAVFCLKKKKKTKITFLRLRRHATDDSATVD